MRMRTVDRGAPALVWLLTLGALCGALAARADDAPFPFFGAPTKVLEAAGAVPVPDQAEVDVLLEEMEHRFDAQGRKRTRHRLVYRVHTAAGVEGWGTTQARYSPRHEERPVIRARVIAPDGSVRVLEPDTLAESSSPVDEARIYDEQRLIRGPLPGVAPGVIVEEEVLRAERKPLFSAGSTWRYGLDRNVPVARLRHRIEAPLSLPLRTHLRGIEVKPVEEKRNGLRVLTFDFGARTERENTLPFLPPETPLAPSLAIATGKSWAHVAKAYAAIVEEKARGADVSQLARELTKDVRGREAVIARLVEEVHKRVRYEGIEFGEGGIVPRTPEETLRRAYGDCKDKSLLLVALLRARGIDAKLALLRSGHREDIAPELPGLGAFNHAIVYVPGKRPLWIDATADSAPVGVLPTSNQGRLALIVDKRSRSLVEIPRAEPRANRYLERRVYQLPDEGLATVHETTEAYGPLAANMRAHYRGLSPETRQQRLEGYAKNGYLAERLTGLTFPDLERTRDPFRMELAVEESRRGGTGLKEAFAYVDPRVLLDWLPDALKPSDDGEARGQAAKDAPARTEPFYLPMPYEAELHVRVVPPLGYEPRALPEERAVKLAGAELSRRFERKDREVVGVFRLALESRRFSPEAWQALKDGIAGFFDGGLVQVAFDFEPARDLAAGRTREAFEGFRALVKARPDSALDRERFATALLQVGLGRAARKAAQEAVRLAPDRALAHATLGFVRMHDEAGRWLGGSHDYEGAVDAIEKAKALNPDDTHFYFNLASLHRFERAGRPTRDPARLAHAIAELEAARAIDPEATASPLLETLLQARRYARVLELAPSLPKTRVQQAALCVARAAEQGVDVAIAALRRERVPFEAAHACASDLMRNARYPEASALMNAIASEAANPMPLRSLAHTLASVKPADLAPPADDPEAVARHLLLLLASPEVPATQLKPYALHRRKLDEVIANQRKMLENTASGVDLGAFPRDSVASLTRTTKEGDPVLGYRIQVHTLVPGEPSKLPSLYVVRRKQSWRVMVLDENDRALLGHEALRHLEAGREREARQWLDWARETILVTRLPDPMYGPPIVELWPVEGTPSRDDIALAAASLIAVDSVPDRALPLLRAALQRPLPPERKLQAERALAFALHTKRRFTELLPLAERLHEAHPKAFLPSFWLAVIYQERRDPQALRTLAEERLRVLPDDTFGASLLSQSLTEAGRFAEAEALLTDLAERGKADARLLNELAWLALFTGAPLDVATSHALRATQMREFKHYASLHTLASLYAEAGRVPEALDVMRRAIDLEPPGESDVANRFVWGRIAESLGLPDVAREIYMEGELPDERSPTGVVALIKKRLQVLDGEAP